MVLVGDGSQAVGSHICVSPDKSFAGTIRGPNYFSMGSHQNGNFGLHQDSIKNNDRVDESAADSGHL